ncbi:MAG: DUF3783 domain-containing protein [Hyphomicrobiales bacterium]
MVEKSTFAKVTGSEKRIYGPRKLVLCGFSATAQSKFEAILRMMGIADVPKVWVTAEQQQHTLADLLEFSDGSGAGVSSPLPRAVIVSGITEAQLIGLMSVCKKSGMTQALWACLTPVSENWPLQQLLAELAREREAMQKRK